MAFFGLHKKKKKKEGFPDLDLPEPSLDTKQMDLPPTPNSMQYAPQQAPMPPQPVQYQQPMQDDTHRLILAKLDAINVQLENLNQRMANLEKIAAQSQEPIRPWYTKR